MADRTSAALLGQIFKLLAENPTDEHKRIAQKIWGFSDYYDFSPYQMDADEACYKLGIARRGIHPEYPEDGETYFFEGDEGFEEAKPIDK